MLREKRTERHGVEKERRRRGEENRGEATDRLLVTKLTRNGSYQLHEVK